MTVENRTTKDKSGKGKVAKKYVETPLMKQYYTIKEQHPDAILLFRVGDFYETFGEDAILAAKTLGITLTQRANGAASFVELAGFPYHALDTYMPKLVASGLRVAICEQLEDPKTTKKIVKRGVTELITPGVAMSDSILNNRENNFLASISFGKSKLGVSFLDISTGEFLTTEGSATYIDKLLSSFSPKEVLFKRGMEKQFTELFGTRYYTYRLDDWIYSDQSATDRLQKQFSTNSLKGFGIDSMKQGVIASGAILHYLDITHNHKVGQISHLTRIEQDRYVWMDKFTIRNLELLTPINDGAKTVVSILDRCITSMGARTIRRWISLPLRDKKEIGKRHDVVKTLIDEWESKDSIEEQLHSIGDLERIISKVATGRINPRELQALKRSLDAIIPIKKLLLESSNITVKELALRLFDCTESRGLIERVIKSAPPVNLSKGGVINSGIDSDLDTLRTISSSGKEYLEGIRVREVERTGITSLKIAFNNVFGYYIEVRNAHKDKVPEEWIRKQTLVNAERYITEELKVYETKILGAEEKILAIENRIYNDLVLSLSKEISPIQKNATTIAELDTLISFANVAITNKYTRPEINDTHIIDIKDGRHPVIEQQLPIGEEYIANDIYLDNETQQIMVITGPNMAGKSALLRQTALIVLLAQVGSFVPAKSCKLGYIDKIFTRVGASDNISSGESTFMIEMNEAATILNNISERSLILFDELGRGTSTYDGISIAWSIVEYLHTHQPIKAKTLFATHYHELNEMEKQCNRVKNFNVSIKEVGNRVIFLRKLVRGGSNHSFGIHVAKMAGMPNKIIDRANDVLKQLEMNRSSSEASEDSGTSETSGHSSVKESSLVKKSNLVEESSWEGYQTTIFQLDDPTLMEIKEELKKIDLNNITPIEALNKLERLKKQVGLE